MRENLETNMSGKGSNSNSYDNQSTEEKPKLEQVEICGQYERYTTINSKLVGVRSIDHFYFLDRNLTRQDYLDMKAAIRTKYHSGALMYSARPYTTDIGQYKLVFDYGNILRCKIEDMYTVEFRGRLNLRVDVLLIDSGRVRLDVPLDRIYDIPPIVGTSKDIVPEAKISRVFLGDPVPLDYKDDDLNEYFMKKVIKGAGKSFNVKILDFQNGIYNVDFISKQGESLIRHLREKFSPKIEEFELIKGAEEMRLKNRVRYIDAFSYPSLHLLPGRKTTISNDRNKMQQQRDTKIKAKKYSSALQFFRESQQLRFVNDKEASYMQRRLHRVKVMSWRGPDEIYILPDEPDYSENHVQFQNLLDEIQDKSDRLNEANFGPKNFIVGQMCLFKNDFERNLGKWLRGVVIEVPRLNRNGFLKTNGISKIDSLHNESQPFSISDFVYEIKSLDFGFKCIRSAESLRHVDDVKLFTNKGSWALRCKLFGIYPSRFSENVWTDERIFSDTSLRMMESWLRKRNIENRKNIYKILFRSDLKELDELWLPGRAYPEISLFYRFESPFSSQLGSLKIGESFDCLNWDLVDQGGALDSKNLHSESSNVDLDHYVVNRLVAHGRI